MLKIEASFAIYPKTDDPFDSYFILAGKAKHNGRFYGKGYYLSVNFSADDVLSAWTRICEEVTLAVDVAVKPPLQNPTASVGG